jgi:putative hydrolase of the HAD superfamily
MAISAVIFDIGGVLEVTPRGGDPTAAFPELVAAWEARLQLSPGELAARIREMDVQLIGMGRDGSLGTCSEEEWVTALRHATGMSQVEMGAFLRDFWDVYLGELNVEVAAYFSGLRPRYRTALLSNSFVGARRMEQERYHFDEMTDLIVYSHEEGIAKPDPRIFARTCERLGVQPTEAIFLDDSPRHVAAARELGLHAILFSDTAWAIADIQACLDARASK